MVMRRTIGRHISRGTHHINGVIRLQQRVIGLQIDAHVVALLKRAQVITFVVEDVKRNFRRDADLDLGRPAAQALFLDRAQDDNAGCFDCPGQACTSAMLAHFKVGFDKARVQALA